MALLQSQDNRHGRVTKLELKHLRISGSLSPYIGNLSFLRESRLVGTNFYNQIPLEIGGLRRLERLQLTDNSISGEIPSNLSACSKLTLIDMRAGNAISGVVPVTMFNLSNMRAFDIGLSKIQVSAEMCLHCLNSIFGITLTCSTEPPSERMDMSDVVAKLYSMEGKSKHLEYKGINKSKPLILQKKYEVDFPIMALALVSWRRSLVKQTREGMTTYMPPILCRLRKIHVKLQLLRLDAVNISGIKQHPGSKLWCLSTSRAMVPRRSFRRLWKASTK
ncbi:hypothetical protein F3Y22_tig00112249pilonHSYRG00138 [Hibiscus syriacus]|uniref:Uncharacterized protein n=1 Tax=Hibiscus syriacus TaxID=106335 RepID=A0A6A2XHL2_HIBSY|nr:hypothetical protein F3Y22_tig00112249pilonHSYRG00138 [Hibiscus syriacus]